MPDNGKTEIMEFDAQTKTSFLLWMDIMNDLTGGAFRRGYRPALDSERIHEWDMLTQEQIQMLRESKGDEWLAKQGAEIDKLRKAQQRLSEGK